MHRIILILCSLIILASLGVVFGLYFNITSSSAAWTSTSSSESEREMPVRKADDKCWFRSEEGLKSATWGKIKARQDRQMFGYEKDLPLSEAIAEFNIELACSPPFASTPPLTESEFVRAIASVLSGNGETADRHEDSLRRIMSQKMLPKASLVHFGADGNNANGEPVAKTDKSGVRIYFVLGLDPAHGHKATTPDQRILVRDDTP